MTGNGAGSAAGPGQRVDHCTGAPRQPLEERALEEIRSLERGGGSNLLGRVIAQYLQDGPLKVAALQNGCAAGDAAAISWAAHPFKSSSACLGAVRLSELCGRLDREARAGELDGAAQLVAEIDAEFQAVAEALAAVVAHSGGSI